MQRHEACGRGKPPHSGASFMVPISSAVAASVGASLLSASTLARLAQLAKLPICTGMQSASSRLPHAKIQIRLRSFSLFQPLVLACM